MQLVSSTGYVRQLVVCVQGIAQRISCESTKHLLQLNRKTSLTWDSMRSSAKVQT